MVQTRHSVGVVVNELSSILQDYPKHGFKVTVGGSSFCMGTPMTAYIVYSVPVGDPDEPDGEVAILFEGTLPKTDLNRLPTVLRSAAHLAAEGLGWYIQDQKDQELLEENAEFAQLTQKQLEQMLRFELVISKISTRFVGLTENMDEKIQLALKEMGEASNASRAYIFLLDQGEDTVSNTHEWCSAGVSSEIENLKKLPCETFQWWMSKLKADEIILVEDVDTMLDEAVAEKAILESQNIKSILVLPLKINGVLKGFIGFDNVKNSEIWRDEDIVLLKIASEIFGSAFTRKAYDETLKRTNLELTDRIEELKNLQSQMIQQGQMAGVGHLASGVAHEINNPLSFVSSNCEILKSYVHNYVQLAQLVLERNDADCREELEPLTREVNFKFINEDILNLIEDTHNGIKRVADIIRELRAFSDVDHLEEQNLYDINEGIQNTLKIMEASMKHQIKVHLDLNPVPNIVAYGGQLNQVIMNLMLNAMEALKERTERDHGDIWIKTWHSDQAVHLEVKDNGTGIDPEHIRSIFNPFFTTKQVGTGTGLGLSISYEIVVKRHNGWIEANSTPGEGAVFQIKLPV